MCSCGVISAPPEGQDFEKKDQLFRPGPTAVHKVNRSNIKIIEIHVDDSWLSQIEVVAVSMHSDR